MNSAEDFLTLARVVKTQGRRGEVACDLFTDFPEKFAERRRVFLFHGGKRHEAHIASHWMHAGRVVLKFDGIDDMDAAAALVGAEVQIPESERAQPEAGAYYIHELVGCMVYDRSVGIGTVETVDKSTSATPLLVVLSDGVRVDVPFVAEYIESVDVAKRELRMSLPEGLLDVNRAE